MTTYTGQTIEEAVEKGLTALKLDKNEVEVAVIQEPKKGFLGFGKKEALVKLSRKKNESPQKKVSQVKAKPKKESYVAPASITTDKKLSDDEAIANLALYLTDITKSMGVPSMVKVQRQKTQVVFNLESDKPGLLIGRHGKNLNAFQYLSQVYIHRIAINRLNIMVNVGDYRERRQKTLERMAHGTAAKAVRTERPVFLEPMPAFERKQVHAYLSNHPEVKTHSEGDEPHRYLIVEPVKTII